MFALFKLADKHLVDLGFEKITDASYNATYERVDPVNGYTQIVDILHKHNGRHIILSYDKDLHDSRGIGNTCVGLTYEEMKWFTRKMKEKGWMSK